MPSIRHQVNIAAPQRSVWRALTTSEGLASWWADEARADPREGGRVVITTEDDEGNPLQEIGTFVEFRPVRKVAIKWDRASPADTRGTTIEFQVARDGEETRVSMVHSGGGPLDDEDVRKRMEREWKGALRGLRSALE